MRTSACACLLTSMCILTGCGAGDGGRTPQATFEAYKSARARKDFEGIWAMLSEASRKMQDEYAAKLAEDAARAEGDERTALESTAKLMHLTVDDMKKLDGKTLFVGLLRFAAGMNSVSWERTGRAEFDREEIDGERARVYYKIDGKVEADKPVELVREQLKWKLDLTGFR